MGLVCVRIDPATNGDGEFFGEEISEDPALASLCSAAFDTVWERATDHHLYQPAK